MSVQAMAVAWGLDLPAPQKFVLLAMADHADHEGKGIFPSMDLVAWKVGYSERQVRRIVNELVKKDILFRKTRPGMTTLYSVNMFSDKKQKPFQRNPGQTDTPDNMSTHPGHFDTPTPDIAMSDEPSLEPSIKNTPAPKSQALSKSPKSYPTSTKRWNREHAVRYWQENKSKLDTLATAWGRDLKFCDSMSKFEMVEFIDTLRDLTDAGVATEKFESLAVYTRAKMSWKGDGMRPTEMVKLVTQWRESHVVTPAQLAMTESMIMNAAIFAEGKV